MSILIGVAAAAAERRWRPTTALGRWGLPAQCARVSAAATGLATLADDEFGGGPTMPMVPGSWNADQAGESWKKAETRLMRQRSSGVNAELSLAWLLEPLLRRDLS